MGEIFDPFEKVLNRFISERTSIDTIGHIDVLYTSHCVAELVKVIEDETSRQLEAMEPYLVEFNILREIAEKAKNMEKKMKSGLHMQLKNILNLPDIAVSKVLDQLLDESFSGNIWEIVKFEETKHPSYRGILLKAHQYFSTFGQHFSVPCFKPVVLGDHVSCCYLYLPDMPSRVKRTVRILKDINSNDGDWQGYFGFVDKDAKTS